MSLINHSRRTGTLEQVISRHEDGSILQGEAAMYERILHDCKESDLHWHMWYDLSLPIAYAGNSEIQIDFLLICEKGAIVLEVKGGAIQVIHGRYYYSRNNGTLTQMRITPFEQAHNYKWALLNHHVLNEELFIVDYAVAFPHQKMDCTNNNENIDESFWLWDKQMHDDKDVSFADFCENILDDAKERSSRGRYMSKLSDDKLEKVINELSPTLLDKSRYTQSTLAEVLNWLHIDNLEILEGLSKNKRLFIEGGPGTGKTTMAKAFIKKNKGLKGLYLCQNILLQARVNEDLIQEDLYNCEVYTFNSYLKHITHNINDDTTWSVQKLQELLPTSQYSMYDYLIIDEAQDIADQGINVLIDYLTSTIGDGMVTGNYLVFYDLEQGYNSKSRHIEDFVSTYLSCSTHFKLNENKRVITNKQIVEIANGLLSLTSSQEYSDYMSEIYNNHLGEENSIYFQMNFVDSQKELSKAFRKAIQSSSDVENTVVLVHSTFKHISFEGDEDTIYDKLSDKNGIHILDANDIANPDKSSIPFTSILKYKGLETHKVILVIPKTCVIGDFKNFLFEVYVGMTRAMMELQIIIYQGK